MHVAARILLRIDDVGSVILRVLRLALHSAHQQILKRDVGYVHRLDLVVLDGRILAGHLLISQLRDRHGAMRPMDQILGRVPNHRVLQGVSL